MKKYNSGFTLVELIVSIAASAIVIAAALSFMMLGMRMEKSASDNADMQSETSIIMRALENIAAEGGIAEIKYNVLDTDGDDYLWQAYDADGLTVLGFNSSKNAITGRNNAVIIENIKHSELSFDGNLLVCDIETTSADKYSTSVYCRMGAGKVATVEEIAEPTEDEAKIKELFEHALEKAGEKNLNLVVTDTDWTLKGAESETLLAFISSDKKITGVDEEFVEDIKSSAANFDENLLICRIETVVGREYSVYVDFNSKKVTLTALNTQIEESKIDEALAALKTAQLAAEMDARKAFLLVLLDQYGSTGKIYEPGSLYHGLYYSQWYKLEWGKDTPWCSIFMSWGLNRVMRAAELAPEQNLGALVDDVMWYQFGRRVMGDDVVRLEEDGSGIPMSSYSADKKDSYVKLGTWVEATELVEGEYKATVPNPGDLVFFERGDDNGRADHIGAVLYIDEKSNTLYTVEGNNNNRVGVFAYPYDKDKGIYMTSEMCVIGYGYIDWVQLGLAEKVTEESLLGNAQTH